MKKLLLIIIGLFLLSTAEAGHFAPKQGTYRHNSYRKNKPNKKADFVCTRTKRITRNGTLR